MSLHDKTVCERKTLSWRHQVADNATVYGSYKTHSPPISLKHILLDHYQYDDFARMVRCRLPGVQNREDHEKLEKGLHAYKYRLSEPYGKEYRENNNEIDEFEVDWHNDPQLNDLSDDLMEKMEKLG
jgi:hypothetical protein